MKKLLYLCSFFTVGMCTSTNAQTTFQASESIDINNIKAKSLVHGDLWWDPSSSFQSCEFPKGSAKHIMGAGSIWMAGYDAGGNLHQSAQTYRQSGNDYWPGPLDNNAELNYITSQDWAKIWKVEQTDINAFKAIVSHTTSNTPAAILESPAKKNPYAKGNMNAPLSITTDMAPFVDVNADGNYNPLDGDYPDIKGDQMLWWIFSDNGPTHNHSKNQTLPLKMEVKARAYGYNSNTLVDNVVFYELDIMNKSGTNYSDFRFGVWSDADLGYSQDDFIGFDSSRRMAIVYNGLIEDGTGQPGAYGTRIPQSGITFIRMPGDNYSMYQPAGSFMYYNNDYSVLGNPRTDTDYNGYLRATWRNGSHLTNTFAGPGSPASGYGPGTPTNYVFPGDPTNSSEWSECISANYPGDRRFIIATGDHTFSTGTTAKVVFALVATNPDTLNSCPGANFDNIKAVADTAWNRYWGQQQLSVNSHTQNRKKVSTYPNPAQEVINIAINNAEPTEIRIIDALGRVLIPKTHISIGKAIVDIAMLPAGMYHLTYSVDKERHSATFIKE